MAVCVYMHIDIYIHMALYTFIQCVGICVGTNWMEVCVYMLCTCVWAVCVCVYFRVYVCVLYVRLLLRIYIM